MSDIILSEKDLGKIAGILGKEPKTKQVVLTEREAIKLGGLLDKASKSIEAAGTFLLNKLSGEEAPKVTRKPRKVSKKTAKAEKAN
jgi:hypothetical protein